MTANIVVTREPLYVAVIVATRVRFVRPVVTGNVARVDPAGTVTLAGTETTPESLESETAAPPAGAAQLSSTVALRAVPPTTLYCDGVRDSSDGVKMLRRREPEQRSEPERPADRGRAVEHAVAREREARVRRDAVRAAELVDDRGRARALHPVDDPVRRVDGASERRDAVEDARTDLDRVGVRAQAARGVGPNR